MWSGSFLALSSMCATCAISSMASRGTDAEMYPAASILTFRPPSRCRKEAKSASCCPAEGPAIIGMSAEASAPNRARRDFFEIMDISVYQESRVFTRSIPHYRTNAANFRRFNPVIFGCISIESSFGQACNRECPRTIQRHINDSIQSLCDVPQIRASRPCVSPQYRRTVRLPG